VLEEEIAIMFARWINLSYYQDDVDNDLWHPLDDSSEEWTTKQLFDQFINE